MSTVVFRLDRGPFQGVVSRHDEGPWSGWYAVSWSAGDEVGGRQAAGLTSAIAQLKSDYMIWLAEHQAR